MERVIKKDIYGNIACNNILIYTNNGDCLGDNIESDLYQDWEVIKPKYYKYKDDDCLIEIWYDEKGIILDKGNNKFLKNGFNSNSWTDEHREEISYKQAMEIIKMRQDKGCGNKDSMSKVKDEFATENIDYARDDAVDAIAYVIEALKQNNNDGDSDFTPDYYGARCKCGEKIDAYAICDKYAKPHKGSAWHHALKKLLRAGDGHKTLAKDIDEVIDSLKRWKEQICSQDNEKDENEI